MAAKAWFDAMKLEESTVATPWSPAAIGASVIDAGGVQIDGTRGGIFRYKGSHGEFRDTVEGGPNGLVFGADVEVYSPSTGQLVVGGNLVAGQLDVNALNVNGPLDADDLTVGAFNVDGASGNIITYPSWGSYTPSVGGIGSGGHSTAEGHYFRIGQYVFIRIYLACSANGTGTGNVSITTPSEPDRLGGSRRQMMPGNSEGHIVPGAISLVTLAGDSGNTWSRVRQHDGTNMIGTDYENGGFITIQGWYKEV